MKLNLVTTSRVRVVNKNAEILIVGKDQNRSSYANTCVSNREILQSEQNGCFGIPHSKCGPDMHPICRCKPIGHNTVDMANM